MSRPKVAVIGGGYSGTLAAIHLLRRGANVILIERYERLARGVAYSTAYPDHLLNVRASAMSALADEPDHFARWWGDPDGFAERRGYGEYLEHLLRSAAAEAGDRLETIHGEAVDIVADEGGETVLLAGGESVSADAAVIAIGNLPPPTPPMIAPKLVSNGVFVADPWKEDFTSGLTDENAVLLIGTGLTAIDAALMLEANGFGGRILALSRRGMVPRAHAEPGAPPKLDQSPEPGCTALVRHVRRQAASLGWRAAVDQLRPVTQALWRSAPVAEKRRFLRHLRPYWDVHRHRIAPEIAERIRNMVADGRLQFAAGKILSTNADGEAARVEWRPRGSGEARRLRAARIVNCTGPETNIGGSAEPLLRNLVAGRRIRPDDCGIGIDIDEASRVIAADARASATLTAVGPLTRGAWWEIVAVPDIRVQVAAVAERIAA